MTIQKISFPDLSLSSAYVVTDLDDASRATGVVRSAKKILQDGAKLMARSQTYAWAVLGQQISGASAGINTQGDERSGAIAGFCEQVLPRVSAGELSLDAAKGVSAAELSDLLAADRLGSRLHEDHDGAPLGVALLVAGVTAAAGAVLGDIDGRTFAVEDQGDVTAALVAAITELGGKAVTDSAPALFGVEADVLICGSKSGLIDHESAASLAQQAIIPIGSTPITARGLAVARRRGIRVLADFVTTAGPLVVELTPTADPAELISTASEHVGSNCSEFADHPDGDLLAACYKAEEFLRTWRDELPFGRPIA